MFYYSPYSLTDLGANYASTYSYPTYGLYAPSAFSK